MKKLDHKWLGPYQINKVISCNAYSMELPSAFGRTHPVFSVVLLHPYEEDPVPEHHTPPPPPPIIWDGVPEYEVERILDSWVFCGRLEYLVCWKGYGTADDQWVPARDVSGARRLVAEFHKWNPELLNAFQLLYMPLSPSSLFRTSQNHPQDIGVCISDSVMLIVKWLEVRKRSCSTIYILFSSGCGTKRTMIEEEQ